MAEKIEERPSRNAWLRRCVTLSILLAAYVLSPPWMWAVILSSSTPTPVKRALFRLHEMVYPPIFDLIYSSEAVGGSYDAYLDFVLNLFY